MSPRLRLLGIFLLGLLFWAALVRWASRDQAVEAELGAPPELAVPYRASSARKWLMARDVDLPRAILEPDRGP